MDHITLLILLDLTEPVHAQHDSGLIIEKILLKRTGLPSVCRGNYVVVGTETHLIVNSNVADQIIYLHGSINSSSHTLP